MRRFFIFFAVSISRILYPTTPRLRGAVIIYLGQRLLFGSSGTPLDYARGSALHEGKDFAVSPLDFARGKPQTYTRFYPFQDTFSFQLKRHCSHLYSYLRRVLPATILPTLLKLRRVVFGLSST